MEQRCNDCGARVFPGADWCTVCYSPVAEPSAPAATHEPAPEAVPALIAVSGAFRRDTEPVTRSPEAPARPDPLVPTWTAAANAGPGPYGWTADINAAIPVGIAPVPTGDTSAFGTGLAMVGLGVLTTIGLYAWGSSRHLEPNRLIVDGLYGTVALYALVAFLVVQKARRVAFRPLWVDGDPNEVLVRGIASGAGLAVIVLVLARLATGHLQGDVGITAILAEQSLPRTLAVIAIACVAAPWVEELLFRGLLAESWRERGIRQAAQLSGIMFALWHPQALFPLLNSFLGHTGGSAAPFLYYVAMGSVFARLYLKHGLKCSIAAHTAFNGVLVLVALTVIGGPTHTIEHNGVKALVPSSWQIVSSDKAPMQADMVLEGPSGAGMVVMHVYAPDVTDASAAAARFQESVGAGLGGKFDAKLGAAHAADYPMGQALHQQTTIQGHQADFVLVVRAPYVYEIILVSGGSGRAEHQFEDILQHMILPVSPPPAG